MRAMIAQGYTSDEIFAAGDLMFMYGSDLVSLLERRVNGESWEFNQFNN